ncbi:cystathionine beta-lyase [Eubacteriales bacterium]|nr:pyridoxal phosphate-dependent aminotransferase [Oscillospiraceae bacterium]MCM0708164.1 pyridoxal phosphate-dependent aminotransferase [Faecalicatena sp. BF-R-105]GKH51045.1 cystathionine beta-lyase [Eubacteriales bacterium]GKH63768.1 cystathionine beta-lyase [Eubacteriales bacterium]
MKRYNFDRVIDRSGTQAKKLLQLPKGAPDDVLSLWIADMDFACADPILEALHRRIDEGIFGYTQYKTPECMAAITGWFFRRFGWEIDPGEIFFSPGVVPALGALISILSDEGDGIVIQNPVYGPFAGKIAGNGRRVVQNPLICRDGDYTMDFDDLAAKLDDPTVKGMILCSPHNPSGRVWTQEELKTVVSLCEARDKWIIADEIHCDIVRAGVKHHPLLKLCPEYRHRIISCTAPSKTFNLAGMQMSSIVIPNPEYQALWKRQTIERTGLFHPGALGVTAMIAAYNEAEDWVDQMNAYVDENFRFAAGFIARELPLARVIPSQGTYLLWVDCRGYGFSPDELAERMLHRGRLALDEGVIFGEGGEGFERINLACPRSVVAEFLKRFCRALS